MFGRKRATIQDYSTAERVVCVSVCVCMSLCMCVRACVYTRWRGRGQGEMGRGVISNYRVCTTKSPERRREERRRRRREKALPLSAELSSAAREENKK